MSEGAEVISNVEPEAVEQLIHTIKDAAASKTSTRDSEYNKQITIIINDQGQLTFELSGIEQESVPIWLKRAAISAEEMLLSGVR